jgi:hypothetical protein
MHAARDTAGGHKWHVTLFLSSSVAFITVMRSSMCLARRRREPTPQARLLFCTLVLTVILASLDCHHHDMPQPLLGKRRPALLLRLRGGAPKPANSAPSQGVNKPAARKSWYKKKTDGPLDIWLALTSNTSFAVTSQYPSPQILQIYKEQGGSWDKTQNRWVFRLERHDPLATALQNTVLPVSANLYTS